MPDLKLKVRVFSILMIITFGCGVKQSTNDSDADLKDTTSNGLKADTIKTKGAAEVNLSEARRIVEENKNGTQNVTGDFNEYKTFLKGLNKYSLYSIPRAEDYVRLLLSKVNAEYKDSTYLYFLTNFYRIANNQSDSLYIKFPQTTSIHS